VVVRYMMEDTAQDQYRAALHLATFPASFSVLLDRDVSCQWSTFRNALDSFFPVVGSCQVEFPQSKPVRTRRTGTAHGGSCREARKEGGSVGSGIERTREVRHSDWNVAYLASCIATIDECFRS
jgi:hypothetical protein